MYGEMDNRSLTVVDWRGFIARYEVVEVKRFVGDRLRLCCGRVGVRLILLMGCRELGNGWEAGCAESIDSEDLSRGVSAVDDGWSAKQV